MNNINKKNIIVTGATGGIGNSIIEKLHEQGAKILATGTNEEKLEKLQEKFNSIEILRFDISNHEMIEDFVNKATDVLGGNLDCLINNAGITRDNLTIRMTIDEWSKVIDLN